MMSEFKYSHKILWYIFYKINPYFDKKFDTLYKSYVLPLDTIISLFVPVNIVTNPEANKSILLMH